MSELWTPTKEHERRVTPTQRKSEGGSFFDDELATEASEAGAFVAEMNRLISHLNERPDHTVYVASGDDRTKMREVFNIWKKNQVLGHNPNIRIDYGVPDGQVRIDV